MTETITHPDEELIGYDDFAPMAQGLSEKYFVRASRQGRFPPAVRIGYQPPRWRRGQVQAWFAALLAPLNEYAGGTA